MLDLYGCATGQSLNFNICSIIFGQACPVTNQEDVRAVINVTMPVFEEKYLGLPTPEGRMTKGRFQNLQASLTKRLIQWGDAWLAQPGREVLIKSVAQALPTYIMGVFKLLFFVCDDLTRMVRNFYWGSKRGRRKVHWKAWDYLLQPKCKGGLGFRYCRLFNQALPACQAWRLIDRPNSLCARLLKSRFFRAMPHLRGKRSPMVLSLLKKGLVWRVGNGSSIRVWRDNWILRPHSFKPVSPQRHCRIRFVSELLNDNGSWNVDLLTS